jgi:alkaline phosphatase D
MFDEHLPKTPILVMMAMIMLLISALNNIAFAQNNNINKMVITDGIASGDVTDNSAIVWSRTNGKALMHVQYDSNPSFSRAKSKIVMVDKLTDFAGHMKLDSLSPDTLYHYRIWFSPAYDGNNVNINSKLPTSDFVIGTFRTAPHPWTTNNRTISFVVGGDLGGQNYCRRDGTGGIEGYPIFSIMQSLSPDFFIFNGDQIYGDIACTVDGPTNVTGWKNMEGNFLGAADNKVNWNNQSQLQDIYNKHWEYNRADPHLQNLLRNTSMYSQADDHEVVNDYGGKWSYWTEATKNRTGFPNVVKAGINAFFNFSPIDRNKDEPNRIYRSFHWGKDLDLFLLDMHSYRSRDDLPDTPQNNKTLIGKEQLQWLEQSLLNSTATWKVISSDVPTTIPSCFNKETGCDNWATDTTNSTFNKTFTRERSDFLKFLDDHNIKNVVVVTTDVHFPTNILVEDDPNHDGDKLIYHELVSGPISAIPVKASPPDPTINATAKYQESKIFNFGHITIQQEKSDGKVHLISEVLDENGLVRPGSNWDIPPQ